MEMQIYVYCRGEVKGGSMDRVKSIALNLFNKGYKGFRRWRKPKIRCAVGKGITQEVG